MSQDLDFDLGYADLGYGSAALSLANPSYFSHRPISPAPVRRVGMIPTSERAIHKPVGKFASFDELNSMSPAQARAYVASLEKQFSGIAAKRKREDEYDRFARLYLAHDDSALVVRNHAVARVRAHGSVSLGKVKLKWSTFADASPRKLDQMEENYKAAIKKGLAQYEEAKKKHKHALLALALGPAALLLRKRTKKDLDAAIKHLWDYTRGEQVATFVINRAQAAIKAGKHKPGQKSGLSEKIMSIEQKLKAERRHRQQVEKQADKHEAVKLQALKRRLAAIDIQLARYSKALSQAKSIKARLHYAKKIEDLKDQRGETLRQIKLVSALSHSSATADLKPIVPSSAARSEAVPLPDLAPGGAQGPSAAAAPSKDVQLPEQRIVAEAEQLAQAANAADAQAQQAQAADLARAAQLAQAAAAQTPAAQAEVQAAAELVHAENEVAQQAKENPMSESTKKALIIGGSVAGAAAVALLVYRSMKKR